MMRFFRSAFVIARRDFSATVLSKTFIFFLLAPLFPLLFGGVFSTVTARVAAQNQRPVDAVIGSSADFQDLTAARDQMGRPLGDQKVSNPAGCPREVDLAAPQKR